MIVFPSMLINPARESGMKYPDDPDNFDAKEFPHFGVFCKVQLGQPLPNSYAHWTNAWIIAEIPEDKIRLVTMKDLLEAGLEVGYPIP